MAVKATERPFTDVHLNFELRNFYKEIEKHVTSLWQENWNSAQTGRKYFDLVPLVNRHIKYWEKNRYKEVCINRLRFGNCNLKAYLHRKEQHPTGLCTHCGCLETIDHFLFHCNSPLVEHIRQVCFRENIAHNLPSILNSSILHDVIYKHVNRNIKVLTPVGVRHV